MTYLYVLKLQNTKLYVGSTRDMQRRITQHQNGKVRYTAPYRPVELIYYEAYRVEKDARNREKYLKTGKGKETLKQQLKHFLTHP